MPRQFPLSFSSTPPPLLRNFRIHCILSVVARVSFYLHTPRRRRFVEAELRSSLEQINRNPFCERVCDSEHALRPPFQILERRHALVEIVERGTGGVHVERLRVIQPHFERESMSFSENAPRHGNSFAKQRFGFFEIFL